MVGIAVPIGIAFAKPDKAQGPKVEMVEICHLNGASDLVPGKTWQWKLWDFGQIKEIPKAALDGHLEHGDRLFGENGYPFLTAFKAEDFPDPWASLSGVAADERLRIWKHADCAVLTNPDAVQ